RGLRHGRHGGRGDERRARPRAGRGKSGASPGLGVHLRVAARQRRRRRPIDLRTLRLGRKVRTAGWGVRMIDLLVADDRCGFRTATARAIEGIPARRIACAAEFDGRLLVVWADQLDDAAAALARQVPAVVIGNAESRGSVRDEPLALALDGAI